MELERLEKRGATVLELGLLEPLELELFEQRAVLEPEPMEPKLFELRRCRGSAAVGRRRLCWPAARLVWIIH